MLLKTTEPKSFMYPRSFRLWPVQPVGDPAGAVSVMGVQPVALPTVLLSTHTGGFDQPARLDGAASQAALQHRHQLGISFDLIYTGYQGRRTGRPGTAGL